VRLVAMVIAVAIGFHLLMLASHGPLHVAASVPSSAHVAMDELVDVGSDPVRNDGASGDATALAGACLAVLAAGLLVIVHPSLVRVEPFRRHLPRRSWTLPSGRFRADRAPPTPVSEGVLLRT